MRWIALLALCLVCSSAASAAGTDDEYLDVYYAILQGDSLQHNGMSAQAAAKYRQAQSALQQIQSDHPLWNPDMVHFRLDYLAEQLQGLDKVVSPAPASAAAVIAPAVAPPPGLAQQMAGLQEQVRALTAANGELQNKLKEALSVQPAAVSPRELARAGETIVALEKERDLLRVVVEQAKASKPQTTLPAELAKALADAKGLAANQAKQIAQLQARGAELEKKLAAANIELGVRMKELADAEARGDADLLGARAALRQARQQRDEFEKKLEAAQGGSDFSSASFPLPAEPFKPVTPANSPPPTDPPAAAPATNAAPPHTVHTMKDLPPGLGPLMAIALRASTEQDFPKAEQTLQDILRQDENNVYVLANLAKAQLAENHLDDCEKTVLKALALDPNDAPSLYFLGVLRYRQNKLDDALDALSRSAQFNPTNSGTQNYLGCILAEKGRHADAEAALRKALELEPGYGEAHYNLAYLYATENPPSPALARWHYDRALSLGHAKNPDLEKMLSATK
jgi:tetratricopeptide (TPR) repeat protein